MKPNSRRTENLFNIYQCKKGQTQGLWLRICIHHTRVIALMTYHFPDNYLVTPESEGESSGMTIGKSQMEASWLLFSFSLALGKS